MRRGGAPAIAFDPKADIGHVGIYYGLVNGNRTVVDAYDSGTVVGLHSFSQEGGGFSGASDSDRLRNRK